MKQNSEYFATKPDLPDWFQYPSGFVNLVDQGIVQFTPWQLANAEFALKTYQMLRVRYKREMFPIAHRRGSDDVACVEKGSCDKIKIINGYTSLGHENEGEYESFWKWFRHAIDEMIEFNS